MADDQTPTEPQPEPQPEPAPDETPEEQPVEASLPTLPEDLDGTPDDDLLALERQYTEAFDTYRPLATTAQHLTDLQRLQEERASLRSVRETRAAEAARVAEELAKLPEKLEPVPAAAKPSASQVAAAIPAQAPAEQVSPRPDGGRVRVAMVGGEDSQQHVGEEIGWEDLAEEVNRNKRSQRAVLASLPGFEGDAFPKALSIQNGVWENDQLIREAVSDHIALRKGERPLARTAAICEPLDIMRDLPSAFSTDEPVSAIWPQRPIGRLGFQFSPGIDLEDVTDAVEHWKSANQEAVDPTDPDTWKPCVEVTCPPIATVRAAAVTACLTFDNTTEMSNPETIRNFTEALTAMRARTKEGIQLGIVDALSHRYHFQDDAYGALPELVRAINSLVAQMRYANRLNEINYTVIIPPGLTEALTIDRAARAYGVEAETSDVMAYLRGNLYNVSAVVETLDAAIPQDDVRNPISDATLDAGTDEPALPFNPLNPVGTAAVAVPPLDNTWRVRIVDTTAAIYGETGELYVGVQRSPEMLRQNRAQYFVEEYFLLTKHGAQPWATIDVQLCPNGSRAGLATPRTCSAIS